MRRMLLWLAIGMLGAAAPAAAGSVTIYNCDSTSWNVEIYDAGSNCSTRRQSASIWSCARGDFQCASPETCKVAGSVTGATSCADYPNVSGAWVILKGNVESKFVWLSFFNTFLRQNGGYCECPDSVPTH